MGYRNGTQPGSTLPGGIAVTPTLCIVGTGTIRQDAQTLAGTGTRFLTEVQVGDAIQIAGIQDLRAVLSIASDTVLTLSGATTVAPGAAYTIWKPMLKMLGDGRGFAFDGNGRQLLLFSNQNVACLQMCNPSATSVSIAQVKGTLSAGIDDGKGVAVGCMADPYDRVALYTDGKIALGPGNVMRDTVLSRSGVKTLRVSSDGTNGAANLEVTGTVKTLSVKDAAGKQVVSAQQAAVANVAGTAGDAYTATEKALLNGLVTQLNAALARLRMHGLIAP